MDEDAKVKFLDKIDKNSEIDLETLDKVLKTKSTIRVFNDESRTVYVKISKACGEGQDGYWEIPSGSSEPWKRCVYHRVDIKASRSWDDGDIFSNISHIMMVSTECNNFAIRNGQLVYIGPSECL